MAGWSLDLHRKYAAEKRGSVGRAHPGCELRVVEATSGEERKRELAALRRMTPKQLREKYSEVTGEQTRSGNRQHLIKRIAWRIQANAEGGLSERAKKRAAQLARDADIRVTAPTTNGVVRTKTSLLPSATDDRLPATGTVITRAYKGRTVEVTVLDQGFEYEGERYRSLSAVAKAITGSHCNGYLYFKLGKYAP